MIEIRLPKQRLIFEESELLELLKLKPPLWEKAIQRGKSYMRHERELSRLRSGDELTQGDKQH